MTKLCPGCGQEIHETAVYCPVCGSAVPFEKPLKNSVPEQTPLAVQESAAGAEEPTGQEQSSDFGMKGADNLNRTSAKEQVYTSAPQRSRKKRLLILAAGAAVLVIGLCIKGTSKTENLIPAASDSGPLDLSESHSGAEIEKERTQPAREEPSAETIPEAASEESQTMPDHRYEFVIKDCTWNEAFTEAALKGGYLVQFDTDEEYLAVKQELMLYDTVKFWIGGRRFDDSREYHWINANGTAGQEILNSDTYSAYWMQNEPSFRDENLVKDEYYMNIFFYKKENRWVWNDVPDDIIDVMPNYAGKVGYIIEYNQ